MTFDRAAKAVTALICAAVIALVAVTHVQDQADAQRRAGIAAELNAHMKPVEIPRPTVAMFVGDSYSSGAGGVQVPATFPCQTASLLRWECRVDAAGGTGYMVSHTVDGDVRPNYMGRLGMDKRRWKPDVVIVSGGRNDGADPGIGKATLAYFKAERKTFPDAKLIVVLPFWTESPAPPFMIATRKAIRRSAVEAGAVAVIDPDGWLWDDLILDGVHPDAYGHQMIAKRLAPLLAKAVGQPVPILPAGWPQAPRND